MGQDVLYKIDQNPWKFSLFEWFVVQISNLGWNRHKNSAEPECLIILLLCSSLFKIFSNRATRWLTTTSASKRNRKDLHVCVKSTLHQKMTLRISPRHINFGAKLSTKKFHAHMWISSKIWFLNYKSFKETEFSRILINLYNILCHEKLRAGSTFIIPKY